MVLIHCCIVDEGTFCIGSGLSLQSKRDVT